MANKFYDSGQERASKVRDLFAAIAPKYDLINDLQSFGLHRYWKRKMITMARLQPGDQALDLCCGTADIAIAMEARGASVIGLDFSGPMLDVARQRLAAMESSGVSRHDIVLARGDALRLPLRDEQFDVVTISYGLRNLADFRGGLAEMLRVLKPGGRLLILDFGKPENPIWRKLYFFYLRLFVPLLGRLFCGDSETHAYILESLLHYPAQRGIAALLEELQCRQVRIVNLFGGMMSINYAEKMGALTPASASKAVFVAT
jgi:demethylmenaquinone methyltransferase/2-methoxy-6-polyprenyl-1,4-benzoquinol methylase